MDDGGYYKHGAKYMIWSKNEGSKAVWSERSLDQSLSAYMGGKKMPIDPDYQT